MGLDGFFFEQLFLHAISFLASCRIHRQWAPYAMIGIISQFSSSSWLNDSRLFWGESCHDHGSDHGMFSLYLLLPESVP